MGFELYIIQKRPHATIQVTHNTKNYITPTSIKMFISPVSKKLYVLWKEYSIITPNTNDSVS